MTPEPEDGDRGKAECGRMTVLSLMALYLVLAVATGVARDWSLTSRAGAPAGFVAGAPYR
jgi:hypothetical protein